ncbi:SgcJ/EcaC family oxidoreductase [Micromonospora sp. WMMD729]|uniref:SgcJ/EcaC family oxidoreductase n=1 Tax=Micromonospora sp. WMMD729 TaxID=3404127 RepID=UPI003BF5C84E
MTTKTEAPVLGGSDQAAIGAVSARMVKAWAAHDADAFAELFAEDGTLILPGVYVKGRTAIRDYMADAYRGVYAGTTVTGAPIDVKPLGPGAVALLTVGGVIAAGRTELADGDAIRASWILVKRDDAWLLSVYQNCPRDPA